MASLGRVSAGHTFVDVQVRQEIWEDLMTFQRTWTTAAVVFGSITIAIGSAAAQKRYDPVRAIQRSRSATSCPVVGPFLPLPTPISGEVDPRRWWQGMMI